MEKMWEALGKYASLAAIAALLYFGTSLLVQSGVNATTPLFAGSGLIFVGTTLAVLFFADWRKREGYEHQIKELHRTIKALNSEISEIAKTQRFRERSTRDSIDTEGKLTIGKGGSEYELDTATETTDE